MKNSKWVGVAAGILIILAVGVLYMRLQRPSQNLGFDLPEYIGSQLAERAVGLLPTGGEILFIKPKIPGVQDPYLGAYQRGFTAVITKQGGDFTVTEVDLVADPMDLQAGKPIFGSADLARLVRDYPDGKVFVSVAGIPHVSRAQLNSWAESSPKMVVFAPFGGAVGPLLKAGVLDAAIIPRTSELAEGEADGSSIADQFTQDYEILAP